MRRGIFDVVFEKLLIMHGFCGWQELPNCWTNCGWFVEKGICVRRGCEGR